MADQPERGTIRWQGYDYANVGAFFLTMVCDDRRPLFGRIVDGALHPSPIGELARRCWDTIPDHMPHVDIGEFVVMPNHVHGIVVIRERLVDVRGIVGGAGARHDAPGMGPGDAPVAYPLNAPDTNALNTPGNVTGVTDQMTDDMGTANPVGDHNAADAPSQRTRARHDVSNTPPHDPRARHDAPLRDPRKPPGIPTGALGQIVASYKSAVTRIAYRDALLPRGTPIWQRNYHDHVIRDADEYQRIAGYICDNPSNWKGDRMNR